jgi:hypothetical protein
MHLIKEILDKEIFLDIIMSEQELNEILKGGMLSLEFYLGNHPVNLGVRKPILGEDHAIEKRKV